MDVNSLTLDVRKLKKLTAQDRLAAVQQAPTAPSFLASLTPAQLAALFPAYFRKELPDIGKAASGATPMSGGVTIPGGRGQIYKPTPGFAPPGTKGPSEGPKKSPGVKLTWQQKLDKAYEDRNRPPGARVTPNESGRVNPTELRNSIKDKIRTSKLNGYVPPDGDKYGIKKGTPEEWANYFTGLAQHESALKVTTANVTAKEKAISAGHGSHGLFQLSPDDALNYKLQDTPFTMEQLQDPNLNLDAAIKIHEHWIVNKGAGIQQGAGKYWGPIQKGWTPGSGRDANLPWDEWAVADASAVPVQDDSGHLSTEKDALRKKETLTALPEGIDPGIKKHFETLEPEKQADILKKMTGVPVETINGWYKEDQSNKAEAAAIREKTEQLIGGIGHPEDQWGYEPGRSSDGVDPKLVESMKEAAKEFPLRVRMFSGQKDRSSGAHAAGEAGDVAIIDEAGIPLGSYQDPRTMNAYAMYWQKVHDKATELYGKDYADSLSWLGGDVKGSGASMPKLGAKGKAAYGAGDAMDFRKKRFPADEAYKIGEGWNPKYSHYVEEDFFGIGAKQGRFTAEDYEKLRGFRLSDEQIAMMEQRASDIQSSAGFKNRYKGYGERKNPVTPVQTASEIPQQQQDLGVAKDALTPKEQVVPNMEGLNLGDFKYPEGMPPEAIKYWNSRSLEWRQKQIDDANARIKEAPFFAPRSMIDQRVKEEALKKWEAHQALPPEERARVEAESAAPTATAITTTTGRLEGGVVTETNGQARDPSTYSEEERKRVNAARDLSKSMGNEAPAPIEAPKASAPAPEPKTATQTGMKVIDSGVTTTVPAMAQGGEAPAGENILVNASERVQVIPKHRVSDEDQQQIAKSEQEKTQQVAEQRQGDQTAQNQMTMRPATESRPNPDEKYAALHAEWDSQTPSNERAYNRARYFMQEPTHNDGSVV